MSTVTYSINVARRESNRGTARYVHYCRIALPDGMNHYEATRRAEEIAAFFPEAFECSLDGTETTSYSKLIKR